MVDGEGRRRRIDFRFDMYGYATEEYDLSKRLRAFGAFHGELADISETEASCLISEGGDREFNGRGIMMATRETEVDKRNPDKTVEEVEAEFRRVFGVNQIIWIPRGSYEDEISREGVIPSEDGTFHSFRSATANGHIDEICRFTDENTIVIAVISDEEAAANPLHALCKERLDLAYQAVSQARTQEGKPFRILEMPVPDPIYIDLTPEDQAFELWSGDYVNERSDLTDGTPFPEPPVNVLPAMSYCNFLIANGVVVAQKYYEEGLPLSMKEKDAKALEVLKKAFPDRRIVQISTLALNLYGGGVHCHTRNIPSCQ